MHHGLLHGQTRFKIAIPVTYSHNQKLYGEGKKFFNIILSPYKEEKNRVCSFKTFSPSTRDSWKPNRIISVNHLLADTESAITDEGWRRKERFNYERRGGTEEKKTQFQTCLQFS